MRGSMLFSAIVSFPLVAAADTPPSAAMDNPVVSRALVEAMGGSTALDDAANVFAGRNVPNANSIAVPREIDMVVGDLRVIDVGHAVKSVMAGNEAIVFSVIQGNVVVLQGKVPGATDVVAVSVDADGKTHADAYRVFVHEKIVSR